MFIRNVDMKITIRQRKNGRKKQLEAKLTATNECKVTETQAGELQTGRYSSSESDDFGGSDPT